MWRVFVQLNGTRGREMCIRVRRIINVNLIRIDPNDGTSCLDEYRLYLNTIEVSPLLPYS